MHKKIMFKNIVRAIKFPRNPRIVPNHKQCKRRLSPKQRERLWHRDGCRCTICRNPLRLKNMELDHIKPRVLGGRTNDKNLRVVCHSCHKVLTSELNKMLPWIRKIHEPEKEIKTIWWLKYID